MVEITMERLPPSTRLLTTINRAVLDDEPGPIVKWNEIMQGNFINGNPSPKFEKNRQSSVKKILPLPNNNH